MPRVRRGDIWIVDLGLAAKVRPALILTPNPADEELDLVTVLLHTTALRGNPWELAKRFVGSLCRLGGWDERIGLALKGRAGFWER